MWSSLGGRRDAFRNVSGFIAALAMALTATVNASFPVLAQYGFEAEAAEFDPIHRPELKVPSGGPYPVVRKLSLGLDKSMLIDLPTDLQNVLVSNPDVVDAVVKTSRQVYLLGKEVGEANVYFMGPDGQKLLYLEISVARDVTVLRDALHRLIPGSTIHAEMMGENIVLTGQVASPVDANRAAPLGLNTSRVTARNSKS